MAFPTGISESQCVEQEGPGISSDATEGCYLSSGSSGGAVPEQAVSGAEERWDFQAGDKFKSSKQVYDKEPFQDGGFSHPEGCPTERRSDVINRPQGRLLLHPNSTSKLMTVSLPVEKVEKIKQEARVMIQKRCVSLRELTRLLGRMSATSQAVLPAPLCYRQLQMLKNHVWSQTASFETEVALTDGAIQELHWWMQHLEKWNGKSVLPSEPDLVLETDASLLGWGARCEETPTGGLWSQEERNQNFTHKLSGVTGGSTTCQDICKESHWCSCPSEDGQYHGHIIHQQDGRYKVIHSVRDGWQPLELVPRKRYISLGRTPSGHLQCNGRCGISHPTILIGMGARHECSGSHLQPIGQVRGGSLCNKVEPQATPVCKLATRPLCDSNQCLSNELDKHKGLCFPPMEFGKAALKS